MLPSFNSPLQQQLWWRKQCQPGGGSSASLPVVPAHILPEATSGSLHRKSIHGLTSSQLLHHYYYYHHHYYYHYYYHHYYYCDDDADDDDADDGADDDADDGGLTGIF